MHPLVVCIESIFESIWINSKVSSKRQASRRPHSSESEGLEGRLERNCVK